MDTTGRLSLVSKDENLTVARQCELLEVNRTSVYYVPVEPDRERESLIKSRLDYWHTKMPYLGVRKLRRKLQHEDHIKVGRKLIKRYKEQQATQGIPLPIERPGYQSAKPCLGY